MPRRVMQGVVVSDVADKTVSVRVDRRVMHPIYKKFVTKSKKYLAHDETNAAKAVSYTHLTLPTNREV